LTGAGFRCFNRSGNDITVDIWRADMATFRFVSRVVFLVVGLCSLATAADKEAKKPHEKPAARSVTVVFKKGNREVPLKDLKVGIEDRGLFGTSFSEIDRLPVKADDLSLKVPLENLARIDILSVKKEGRKITEVTLKLTSTDPEEKPLTGQLDSEKPLVWKATHPFAKSEVVLDLDGITAIILAAEKPATPEEK
jgi:hypothetical protein